MSGVPAGPATAQAEAEDAAGQVAAPAAPPADTAAAPAEALADAALDAADAQAHPAHKQPAPLLPAGPPPDFNARSLRRDAPAALRFLAPAAEQGPPGALMRGGFERYLVGDYGGALSRYAAAHVLGFTPLAASNAAYLLRRRLVDASALGLSLGASSGDSTAAAAALFQRLALAGAAGGNADAALLLGELLEAPPTALQLPAQQQQQQRSGAHEQEQELLQLAPPDEAAAERVYRQMLQELLRSGGDAPGRALASHAAFRLGSLYAARAARARQGSDTRGAAAGTGSAHTRNVLLAQAARWWRESVAAAPDDSHRLPALAGLARLHACSDAQRAASTARAWLPRWAAEWLPDATANNGGSIPGCPW